MDPRIEARRDAVRRETGRRRMRALIAVAVVVVLVVGTYLAVQSPFLDVDRVTVVGATHIAPKRVIAAADVDHGRPLLRVDLGAVARRVEQLPWVAHAAVKRDLPGTLRIEVTEARAVAYVRKRGNVAVIGPDDRVIARTHTVPDGAVTITGARSLPRFGELLSPAGTTKVIDALPAELRARVRALALRPDTVALVLDQGEIRLGDVSRPAAKLAAAMAVLREYGDAPFDYIDVKSPADPVARP
jgi:cell division protein FtsQ